MHWQPIETAPNDTTILVAYDDDTVALIDEEDNTYDWHEWRAEDYGKWTQPVLWMPVPMPPVFVTPAALAKATGQPAGTDPDG